MAVKQVVTPSFSIYKLTSPSGKIYIGQTRNLKKRFAAYRNANCIKQHKLYNAILKYGWEAFNVELLFTASVISQESLNELETYYISKYDAVNSGYNCVAVGNSQRGLKFSEESKLKCSTSAKKRAVDFPVKRKLYPEFALDAAGLSKKVIPTTFKNPTSDWEVQCSLYYKHLHRYDKNSLSKLSTGAKSKIRDTSLITEALEFYLKNDKSLKTVSIDYGFSRGYLNSIIRGKINRPDLLKSLVKSCSVKLNLKPNKNKGLLEDVVIQNVRSLFSSGVSKKEISTLLNINYHTVMDITLGRKYKSISGGN